MTEINVIAQPTTELLELAEAKSYLKIDHTDEDSLIALFISAARDKVQRATGVAIGEQTIEWVSDFTKDADPDKSVYLPRRNMYQSWEKEAIPYPPFIELVSVERFVDGDYTTATTEDYEVISGYFSPAMGGTWKVEYTAGHTAESLPPGLKLVWLQLVAYLYTNRQDESADMPQYIRYALNPYKRSLI